MNSDPEFQAIWRQARQHYLPVGLEEGILVRRIAFYLWRAERRWRIEFEQDEGWWQTPARSSFDVQRMQEVYKEIERKLRTSFEEFDSYAEAVVENSTSDREHHSDRQKPEIPARSQPRSRGPIPPDVRQYLLRESQVDNVQLRWLLARLESTQQRRRKSHRSW